MKRQNDNGGLPLTSRHSFFDIFNQLQEVKMANEKKQYLSESIDTELEWIKDVSDRTTRSRLRALDLEILITYTYFVYHNYSVELYAF